MVRINASYLHSVCAMLRLKLSQLTGERFSLLRIIKENNAAFMKNAKSIRICKGSEHALLQKYFYRAIKSLAIKPLHRTSADRSWRKVSLALSSRIVIFFAACNIVSLSLSLKKRIKTGLGRFPGSGCGRRE